MTIKKFNQRFVEAIPETLEDGTLYFAMEYSTVVHKCACGCGREVVTPLSPTDWKMSYDGVSVSLSPSIGNWSFPCRSHYWIKHSNIRWAGDMSEEQIAAGRAQDRRAKGRYYDAPQSTTKQSDTVAPDGILQRISRWFGGK